MYLKSIEVQGFKSFANKILFEFHNGITGIVGPNGSGKSNVADAVRWVLGEQRAKQLRGGNMQDVIFSGTENRKPLSYASVAITLDNSDHKLAVDYQEVTVTRKLYRSGESEYLINGTACRLKDVNELFYDTGIGKEGYSIIGQGQIDKILSGRPEERRELFDEAAGIVKFKRRKAMSVKKLEDERQNLVRVNDILSELEKQVGPLKRQSEVAKEYIKKKEELKMLDINVFLLETEKLRAETKVLEEKLSNAREEQKETDGAFEKAKAEYGRLEEEQEKSDLHIEKLRTRKNETNLLRQQMENQIALFQEQIRSIHSNEEHYLQRLASIREEEKRREGQKKTFLSEMESLGKELSDKKICQSKMQERQEKIQMQLMQMERELEDKKAALMEMLGGRASTKAKIQHFDTLMEQIRVRKSEIHKRLIEQQQEIEVQNQFLAKHEEELKGTSAKIGKLVEEQKTWEEQIEKLQAEISEKTRQVQIGQNAYHRESSRLESLKNITERYDGYGNSIRRVMEQKNKVKGLLGVVADIIKVEKEYEVAIETALGGSIQNVVTEDEGTAKEMISFLKRNKYGRATFLPLTSMRQGGEFKTLSALQEKGVIGLANALVKTEKRYEGLAANLLGRTLVVQSIDDGIALARKYHQSLRIVTLEGELINPGGAMTGGAFKNASNLLGRRREIEEFEKTVEQLGKELKEAETALAQAKEERAGYYKTLDGSQQKLQELYVEQNTAKMNYDQVKAKKQEVSKAMEEILKEGKELDARNKDLLENQDSIQEELKISEQMETKLSEEIDTLQQDMDREKVKETQVSKETENLHLLCAGLEQKCDFIEENIRRVEEELIRFAMERESLAKDRDNAKGEIAEKQKNIEEVKKTIEDSQDIVQEIESEIANSLKERENMALAHKEMLEERERLSKRISDLDREVYRLESQLKNNEDAVEKQMDYMWEEYEITFNHAKELKDNALGELAVMKKMISSLRQEIRGLGNVNVNAIEDYKEVSERYEFMSTQQKDLVEAEATLMQIIAELDEAMRRQFTEQFEKIRTEYDKVFKQLFGGGKGTLELQEDEDILEAGIRIIAQPPGKKLQNMMQLSGGEKALAAISLLFAIQNLKPSPFCLLDEIEAALDDSNVSRFAQYLHKLTKNTQFIVITHRRGTMTAADRLYGITMQEKGISTLVSVDLLENDLTK